MSPNRYLKNCSIYYAAQKHEQAFDHGLATSLWCGKEEHCVEPNFVKKICFEQTMVQSLVCKVYKVYCTHNNRQHLKTFPDVYVSVQIFRACIPATFGSSYPLFWWFIPPVKNRWLSITLKHNPRWNISSLCDISANLFHNNALWQLTLSLSPIYEQHNFRCCKYNARCCKSNVLSRFYDKQ